MKRLLILIVVIVSGIFLVPGQARVSNIDRAVVQFNEPVKLLGVILRGRYLFVHHDGMMAKGKPCTYIYTLDPEQEGKPIASFHCQPVKREKASEFKIVISHKIFPDLPEIEEIQFAESSEGHQVLHLD